MDGYYKKLLNQYVPDRMVVADTILDLKDARLGTTEVLTDSDKGILIVPGLTVPRESYFTLLPEFSDFNVLIYDSRGHSKSEGEVSASGYISDVNDAGLSFKRKYNLKYLVGISHSLGGLCMLAASCTPAHPFDKRIALAPVVKADLVIPKLPENHLMAILFAYLYNIHRTKTQKAFRDEIVVHHQHTNFIDFLKNPCIVALKLRKQKAFSRAVKEFPVLTQLVHRFPGETYVIFPGNDQRLGIKNNQLKGVYAEFAEKASEHHTCVEVLPDLNHRFNRQPETQFRLSYNDKNLLQRIRKIIDG
jgi:hypothetical protein